MHSKNTKIILLCGDTKCVKLFSVQWMWMMYWKTTSSGPQTVFHEASVWPIVKITTTTQFSSRMKHGRTISEVCGKRLNWDDWVVDHGHHTVTSWWPWLPWWLVNHLSYEIRLVSIAYFWSVILSVTPLWSYFPATKRSNNITYNVNVNQFGRQTAS